jgi:hypothetical protein
LKENFEYFLYLYSKNKEMSMVTKSATFSAGAENVALFVCIY